jgi:carbonic anhydrase
MSKSVFLRGAAAFALAGSLMALPLAASAQEWSYEGDDDGASEWGSLTEEFAACDGSQQSPIDLEEPLEAELGEIELNWNAEAEWTVSNNGKTLNVVSDDAGTAMIEGEEWNLVQFHFHTPSEHAIEGERWPMEVHFVHARDDGRLAVIGVMMEEGASNDLFSAIMDAAPSEPGDVEVGAADATAFIPADNDFYRYQGSLTTPPCSEVVLWTVMEEPITVSEDNIEAFEALFDMNARPLQAVNRRYILTDE